MDASGLSDAREERIGQILNELVDRRQRGERFSANDVIDQYPEYADELLDHLRLIGISLDEGANPGGPSGAHRLKPFPTCPGYRLTRELGHGGQGTVYQATHVRSGQQVAVKVLLEGDHARQSDRSRFEREIKTLAAVSHPGIVLIFDCGETTDGGSFFAMEYLQGTTLDRYVARLRKDFHKGLGVAPIIELVIRVADAVQAAHAHGIVHRDLKPGNVLIDALDEPHILDFGLARIPVGLLLDDSRKSMSLTRDFVGSLPWASPEQAEGSPGVINARTDVYSLGMLLYHMLTGGFPFDTSGSLRQTLNNIIACPPTPASKMVPEVAKARGSRPLIDRRLDQILLKALAKTPEARYANAGKFAGELRNFLDGRPISIPTPGRFWRPARLTALLNRLGFGR